jgi:hypothetical protein
MPPPELEAAFYTLAEAEASFGRVMPPPTSTVDDERATHAAVVLQAVDGFGLHSRTLHVDLKMS